MSLDNLIENKNPNFWNSKYSHYSKKIDHDKRNMIITNNGNNYYLDVLKYTIWSKGNRNKTIKEVYTEIRNFYYSEQPEKKIEETFINCINFLKKNKLITIP